MSVRVAPGGVRRASSSSSSGWLLTSISMSPPSSAEASRCRPSSTPALMHADRGDRGDAERQAGEEDDEARAGRRAARGGRGARRAAGGSRHAAAGDRRQARLRPPPAGTGGHRPSAAARAQRAARRGSWVISSSVMPRSRCTRNISSMISWPVSWSRLPVGSSASSSFGWLLSARASAARCCSPPDSWPG